MPFRHDDFPVTQADYAGYLQCPVGQKVRPTAHAKFTVELLNSDVKLQRGEFRVTLNGDPQEYRGTVEKDQGFKFCPQVSRIVYLNEVRSTNAILLVRGLVSQ